MSLSDKIEGYSLDENHDCRKIRVEYLKEAIKELKEEFGLKGLWGKERIEEKIEKVFGRRLTGGESK